MILATQPNESLWLDQTLSLVKATKRTTKDHQLYQHDAEGYKTDRFLFFSSHLHQHYIVPLSTSHLVKKRPHQKPKMSSLHLVHFIKPALQSATTKDQVYPSSSPNSVSPKSDKVSLTDLIHVSNPQKRYHSGSTYHTSSDLTISTTHYLRAAFGFCGSRKRFRCEVETHENLVIDEEARDASLERIRDDLIRAMLEPPKQHEERVEETCQQMKKRKMSVKKRVCRVIGPMLVGHCDVYAQEWRSL